MNENGSQGPEIGESTSQSPSEMEGPKQIEKTIDPELESQAKVEVEKAFKEYEETGDSETATSLFNNFHNNLPYGPRRSFERHLEISDQSRIKSTQLHKDIDRAIEETGLDYKEIQKLYFEYKDIDNREKPKEKTRRRVELLKYAAPAYIRLRSWGYGKKILCK